MHPHPNYPGLNVYEGQKGEKPVPGAFYRPGHNRTLLKECGAAYGVSYSKLATARKVNGNAWNMANAVYRSSDTNCNAPRVSPTYGPGAANASFGSGSPWIAQCPYADPHQIYWFPPKDQWTVLPDDLVTGFAPPPVVFTPPKQSGPTPLPGVKLVDPVIPDPGEYYPDYPGEPGDPDSPDPKSKKWVYIGIGAAILAAGIGIYAWRKK